MAYGTGLFRTGLVVITMAASAPLVASCQTGPGYYGGGGYYGDDYSSSYDDGYWGYDRGGYRDSRYRYRDDDDDRRRYRNRHRDDDDDRDHNRRRRATSRDYDDKTEGARRIFGLDGNGNRGRNDDGDRNRNRGDNGRSADDIRRIIIPNSKD
ncbi:MAG: hypothetical protein JF625_01870 [Inquilinus limosus]|uniref:Uncharacterized protein n=1 Tax=Inquilinus limosus TaxID=171674 RepID=A0A952KBM2_9PROT|nr:hypothetical protein [Inquilinus limosus]